MTKKQKTQTVARKPGRKIADAHRIRFGAGMAPACLALAREDAATRDSRRIRFGAGMISAALKT